MLSIKESFLAMRIFLDKYYFRTKSFDIGGLLGDTILFGGNETADPAAWEDWISSAEKYIKEFDNIDICKAYIIMMDFLKEYGLRVNSNEVALLVSEMKLVKDSESKNKRYWNEWLESIKALNNGDLI